MSIYQCFYVFTYLAPRWVYPQQEHQLLPTIGAFTVNAILAKTRLTAAFESTIICSKLVRYILRLREGSYFSTVSTRRALLPATLSYYTFRPVVHEFHNASFIALPNVVNNSLVIVFLCGLHFDVHCFHFLVGLIFTFPGHFILRPLLNCLFLLHLYFAAAAEGLVGVSLSGIPKLKAQQSLVIIALPDTMRGYSPSLRSSWLINRTSLVNEGFVLWLKDVAGRERTISTGHFGHSGIKPIQRQDCLPLESATYFWSTVKLSVDGKIMEMESSVHGLCPSCIECPREKKK